MRIVNRALGFARTLIIARLLLPEDFGLLGIAMVTLSALETISQTGFQAALVQKKKDVEGYLDTAWTISLIRGFLLFMVLYASAPLIAQFFGAADAIKVIRVIALSFCINGLINIRVLFFLKDLEFKKQFFYELLIALSHLGVAIGSAYLLRNVWALVWAALAANVVRCVLSYVYFPFRLRIALDMKKVRDLFTYGKWVLGSSILIFAVNQGDDIFVGKMLGTAALGFYQMAYLCASLPTIEIAQVVSRVAFPAYSKIKDDLQQLKEAYLKVLQLTTFISFPLAGTVCVFANEFVKIFLGDNWLSMTPILKILVVAVLLRAMGGTSGTLFYSFGKPKIDTLMQIIRLTVFYAFIFPAAYKFELVGIAAVVLISNFISTVGFCLMAIKLIQCKVKEFCKIIGIPAFNTAIAAVIVLGLKGNADCSLIKISVLASMMVLLYAFFSYLSDKLFHSRIGELMIELINPFLQLRVRNASL